MSPDQKGSGETPTPRTDAVTRTRRTQDGTEQVVFADFARELERDLVQAEQGRRLWMELHAMKEAEVQRLSAENAQLREDSAKRLELLRRFFHEGHTLGGSHQHFAAYVAHPAALWDETKAVLDAARITKQEGAP